MVRKIFAGIALSIGLSLSFNPSLIHTARAESVEQLAIEQTTEEYDLEKIIQKEPGIEEYLPLIKEAIKKHENIYSIDPLLIIALLKAETYKFNKNSISWAGAAGLAQIIGETAEFCGVKAYNPEYIPKAREDRRMSYRYRNKVLAELNKPYDDETYVVKKGDTLFEIATKKGKALKEILDANPQIKDPDSISIGDEVIIPCDAEESIKRILEYKRQYQFYKKKANDAFRRYKAELLEMIKDKSEEELREIDERFVPEVAIDFCVKHLAELLRARNGDVREAVSAYNAGLRAVTIYKGIPPYDETVKYQNKIINYYRGYKEFMEGKVSKADVSLDLDVYKGNKDKE